jgi:hypothetical protein
MDSNTAKSLLTTGLNTMAMVAFAIPGGGAAGVELLVLATLFSALFGQEPSSDPAVTRSELKAAVDAVKAEIIDAIFKGVADDITDQVLALQQGFLDVYHSMSRLKMDGERYMLSATNETILNFIWNTNAYFNLTLAQKDNGILFRLEKCRSFLELGSLDSSVKLTQDQIDEHRNRTINLYGVVGSLTVAYLKSAVAWQWGRQLLVAWQYEQYKAAMENWDPLTGDPDQDPAKLYPGVDAPPVPGVAYTNPFTAVDSSGKPSYKPPTWETWNQTVNCPAQLLIQKVNALLDYCVTDPAQSPPPAQDGVYTELLKNLNDLEAKVAGGEPQVTAGDLPRTDQMVTALENGALAAGWVAVIGQVSEEDTEQFGSLIAMWKAAKASVTFTMYTTSQATETLESIADLKYKGEDKVAFGQLLYDANPGIKFVGQPSTPNPTAADWELVPITKGTTIKIFPKEVFPDLNPPDPGESV